jgi:hypothetical protein
MKEFEYYFSNYELLKILSRKRAALAKKEHDKLFHKKMLLENNVQNTSYLLYQIFPPRSEWIRLTKKERKGKNALEINAIQLERTVKKLTKNFRNSPSNQWQISLYKLLSELNNKAFDSNYLIPKPTIKAIFKEEKDKKKIFRPIAYFEYTDRILISQLNKYLTDKLDILFTESSYAFRSTKTSLKSFSHHKAIEDIIEFKKKFENKDLWVAEYDIKKFYDCVNHDVIFKSFNSKINELKKEGTEVNKRAIDLFYSYLNCYSFNHDVDTIDLGKNKYFGWVGDEELTQIKSNKVSDRIGVPQGGALSCLIANIIMDVVDKEVLKHDDGNLFYARFCDDMVLIHLSKDVCNEALKSYSNTLNDVKLIGHDPTEINQYDKSFWDSKSKAPYKWAFNRNDELSNSNVSWLSFVGYQIDPCLKVRVRKSSLKKEIIKQIKETGKIISLIRNNNNFRVSERAIKHRVSQRLLAMSVGRINIFNNKTKTQMCWTSGFRVLKENKFVHYHIKNLDRKRCAQMKRLSNHLRRMNPKQRPEKNFKIRELNKEPDFYGYPFSYYKQFNK